MPILADIRDHDVLGPEYKRGWAEGERNLLRRLIQARFGGLPNWAAEKLANSSSAELEALSLRLLDARSLEELLG